MGAIRDFCKAAVSTIIEVSVRCIIRLALWFITVIGGLLPPLYAADVEPNLDVYEMASKVNEAGLFRDFFYISVVIALIGLCNVLDTFFKGYRPHKAVLVCYIVAVSYCIYMIFFGISEFGRLASHHVEPYVLPHDRLYYDLHALMAIGLMGLFVELLLAFRNE